MLEIGDVIRLGEPADDARREQLRAEALALGPWRKGPFDVCGLRIDAHWNSAPKWHRALAAVDSLSGRTVCDVGCNNGYYLYRMAGAGAAEILGIDPVEQFERQFEWLQSFAALERVRFERIGFEQLGGQFDIIFCMGVLYHVRSPHHLLERLRECLARGGTLILETITADIGEACIVPAGRYAGAAGIHWLPGPGAVVNWLRRCGFSRAELVNRDPAQGEQRRTAFADLACMDESIEGGRTKEGYPAPERSIFRVRR